MDRPISHLGQAGKGSQSHKGAIAAPERHPIPNCKQTLLLTKTSWDFGRSTSTRRVAAKDQLPRRDTRHARYTPRKPSCWDWGGDKSQPSTGGDYTHQGTGHLSSSDLERAQTQAQPSLCLCGVPENLNLSSLDLGNAQNPGAILDSSPAEQL